MTLKIECHSKWNVTKVEFHSNEMSLKMECASIWNVTHNECNSKWNFTQKRMSFKMECH